MNSIDFEHIKNSSINWNKFSGTTILITGANGILPAYMTEFLLLLNNNLLKNNPCKVISLVRNLDNANIRFKDYLENTNLEILTQDVSDEINIIDKIDYIIHAASPASPKYYNTNPVSVILPNVIGTKNTLDLASKNDISGYLYFSSGEVYGQIEDGKLFIEDEFGYLDPTKIRSCYAESKRMGENLCISYGKQHDIPIKIVRPFHTYGPGMKLDDGRVFADFVNNIINDENIEMKSDGSATRAFCYVADATIAFFKVLLDGKNQNAYNVANSDANISIKELATLLVNLFPEKNLKAIFAKQDKNYLQSPVKGNPVDITKLKKLGWSPKISIEEGFKRTIQSYQ